MITQKQEKQLIKEITAKSEFKNAGIAYCSSGMSRIIHQPAMPEGLRLWVVIMEDKLPAPIELKQPKISSFEQEKDSNIITQILGSPHFMTGVSCLTAIGAGAAAAAGTALAPMTAGTSIAVTYITGAGAVASAAQCGIGIGRIVNDIVDPSNNEILDSLEWFQKTGEVLEGVSLLGDAVGMGATLRGLIRFQKATRQPFAKLLSSYNRTQRKMLAQELVQYLGKDSNRSFNKLVSLGKLPKIFTVNQIRQEILAQIVGIIGTVLDYESSAYSDSGLLKVYILND